MASNGSAAPAFTPATAHGAVAYNKTLMPMLGWWVGNNTYNATTAR